MFCCRRRPPAEWREKSRAADACISRQRLTSPAAKEDLAAKHEQKQGRPVWAQISMLFPFVVISAVDMGVFQMLGGYLFTNFWAQSYTTLRFDEIHCEFTPQEQYCISAVNDVVRINGYLGIVNPIFIFIVTPLMGVLSDVLGRRPVLLASTFFSTLPLAAIWLFLQFGVSLWLFYYISPLMYLAMDALFLIIVIDLTPEKKRADAIGLCYGIYFMSTLVGGMVAFAATLKTSFTFAFLIDIVLVLYIFFCFGETLPKERRTSFKAKMIVPGAGFTMLCGNSTLATLTVIILASSFVDGGFTSIMAPYLMKFVGFTSQNFVGLMLISQCSGMIGLVCIMPALTKLWGNFSEVYILFLSRAVCIVLGTWFAYSWTVWEIDLNFALTSPFLALMYPAMASLQSKLVEEHEQGKMQGVLNSVNNIARQGGPILYAPLWAYFDSADTWSNWSTVTIQWANVLIFPMMIAISLLPSRLRACGYHVGHSPPSPPSDLKKPFLSVA